MRFALSSYSLLVNCITQSTIRCLWFARISTLSIVRRSSAGRPPVVRRRSSAVYRPPVVRGPSYVRRTSVVYYSFVEWILVRLFIHPSSFRPSVLWRPSVVRRPSSVVLSSISPLSISPSSISPSSISPSFISPSFISPSSISPSSISPSSISPSFISPSSISPSSISPSSISPSSICPSSFSPSSISPSSISLSVCRCSPDLYKPGVWANRSISHSRTAAVRSILDRIRTQAVVSSRCARACAVVDESFAIITYHLSWLPHPTCCVKLWTFVTAVAISWSLVSFVRLAVSAVCVRSVHHCTPTGSDIVVAVGK